MIKIIAFALGVTTLLAACGSIPPAASGPVAHAQLANPAPKQLFQMTPAEADSYIALMRQSEPDLRKRIAAIGRRNIGQPYMLNLLGEYPYEIHDQLPMFSLAQSDCVVFAEHTYAMALSRNWKEFFWMLQRIRYKDGVVGVASRNHYTEQDWNINNSWLVTDVTRDLAGDFAASYPLKVDRERFLKTRHHTDAHMPVQSSTEYYVPKERIVELLDKLQDGDFVNIISTRDGAYWASHVGLIVTAADGKRMFLNSAEPQVREESFDQFFTRTAEREARNASEGKNGQKLAGFKLLRLNEQINVPPALPQPRP
jgi:hypothetical protein